MHFRCESFKNASALESSARAPRPLGPARDAGGRLGGTRLSAPTARAGRMGKYERFSALDPGPGRGYTAGLSLHEALNSIFNIQEVKTI